MDRKSLIDGLIVSMTKVQILRCKFLGILAGSADQPNGSRKALKLYRLQRLVQLLTIDRHEAPRKEYHEPDVSSHSSGKVGSSIRTSLAFC